MRKGLLVFYVVLSLIVFFTGIQSAFSGHGGKAGKSGNMVYCSSFFPKTCTQGGCTQSDRTTGTACGLINCSAGCAEYKNGVCVDWYYENLVPCTNPNNGGGSGNPSWGDDCDPTMSAIFGECIINPPAL